MSDLSAPKSLKNLLNDLLNGKPSKKGPFVQPERPSERCSKNGIKLLKYLTNHLNDSADERTRLRVSVRSER